MISCPSLCPQTPLLHRLHTLTDYPPPAISIDLSIRESFSRFLSRFETSSIGYYLKECAHEALIYRNVLLSLDLKQYFAILISEIVVIYLEGNIVR